MTTWQLDEQSKDANQRPFSTSVASGINRGNGVDLEAVSTSSSTAAADVGIVAPPRRVKRQAPPPPPGGRLGNNVKRVAGECARSVLLSVTLSKVHRCLDTIVI